MDKVTINSSGDFFRDFRKSFEECLTNTDSTQLEKLKIPSERKTLFSRYIMKEIAGKMNMEFVPEFLRIDYVLCKQGKSGWMVPKICIESENNWDSVYEEVLKLSSINAPLKVLINYGMNEQKMLEIKSEEMNDWYILQDFLMEGQLCGWYAILIYDDSDNQVQFHCFVYNELGKRIEEWCKPIFIG